MSEQARDRAVLLVLVLVSATVLFPLRPYGLQMGNEGWLLHPPMQMLEGKVLYRDVLTYYAPFYYHVLAWAFALFGPSFLLSRTLSAVVIVATAALAYRVGRRWLPTWLAWGPPLVYVLAPGPWFKVNYGFCSMLFFLVLARALERPGTRRYAWMGAAAGLTLVTRHEIGIAQLGIAAVAAALPALFPGRFGGDAAASTSATWRAAGRNIGVTLAAAAAVALPFVLYYASHGALGAMLQMMFVNGFEQMPDWIGHLKGLLSPSTFADGREGRAAGFVLVAPVFVCGAVGIALLVRLQREGLVARNVLTGALLAYAVATLPQTYSMAIVIRLLQSALPFYVLTAYLALEIGRAIGFLLGKPAWAPARFGVPAITVLAGGWLVWLVIEGLPTIIPGDEFTGSWRMRRHSAPAPILSGETVYLPWQRAEEARLVRTFLDARLEPDEPILALPLLTSYYLLLDRPNPTGIVGERAARDNRDTVMNHAQKEREMQRFLDSRARYAIVSRFWFAWPDPPEHMRAVLRRTFHPIRRYDTVVILERGMDETARTLTEVLLRIERGIKNPRDADVLRGVARERPEWPLPHQLLVPFLIRQRDAEGALAALRTSSELDPLAIVDLEVAASILLASGRMAEARDTLLRVHAVRESPSSKALWDRLPESLRQ